MYYQNLFKRSPDNPVRACLMGTGEFGASFLFQAALVPNMTVPALCAVDADQAAQALVEAGTPADKVKVCATAEEAQKAFADGFTVIADRFEKLAGLPLDALVESSGAPDASAAAADTALDNGINVVMVSKETDSVVGSILGRKAKAKGLAYTTGDGDQPSLLIGLVSWARTLGLTIVAAGKSSEYDFVYDPAKKQVVCAGQKKTIAVPGMAEQWLLGDRPAPEVALARAEMLSDLEMRSVADLCEMTVVANATGIMPDRPTFHAPVARIGELADLFCPVADGGLLDRPGKLDIFNCLRRPDEISMAGGEFIIVACQDQKTWKVLEGKGHPVSRNGKYGVVFLPRHLLGIETGISVLAAATMAHPTGGDNVAPVADLHGRAARDLKKGTVLAMGGHHHTIDGIEAFIDTAAPVAAGSPLPFYLFSNLPLVRDVPAGKVISYEDVELPRASSLLRLRLEQDKSFGLTK